jgi:hypothetical protein
MTKNEMLAAKREYEMFYAEALEQRALYNAAVLAKNEEAAELYR